MAKRKEYPKKEKDLSGHTFGELYVTKYEKTVKGRKYWLCNCKCGKNDISVEESRLLYGKKKSCGCQNKRNAKKKHIEIVMNSNRSLQYANGSAFKIEPVTEITASNGNTIIREEPIQDPIVMVNELCETKWKFDSPKRDFQFSIIVKFEDMSAQLYQQTFILTLDSELHIMVMNYAEPKLVSE